MYSSKTITIAFLGLLSQSIATALQHPLEVIHAASTECRPVYEQCLTNPDKTERNCSGLGLRCCEELFFKCLSDPIGIVPICRSQRSVCYGEVNHTDPFQPPSIKRDVLDFNKTCADVRSTCNDEGDLDEVACAAMAAECCDASSHVCRNLPGANMAACAAEKAACYDYAGLAPPYTDRAEKVSCSAVRSECQSSG